MNFVKLCTLALLALLPTHGYCQQYAMDATQECKGHNHYLKSKAYRTTVATPQEDDYDIHYVKFDLHLTDTAATISGNVTTKAHVVSASLPQYMFELDDSLKIDSVKIDGNPQSFSSSGRVRIVDLSPAFVKGNQFTAQVFYHGNPRNASSIHDPGLHHDSVTNITFTIGEPYFAHLWWPCKQSLRDKIDSMDMWITVPRGVKAGSNGALKAITPISLTEDRYEWKSNYPIDYYLISASVSRYDEYSYQMHFDGSTDSMPIVNYISHSSPLSIAELKPWLDSTEQLINYLSGLFGRYPFWKEKYGHCYIPAATNMEHQTMTSTRFSRLTVIAHELAHQWFGDQVTCGTWQDIWLNEGFAAYAQYLCYNHFDGYNAGFNYLGLIQQDATSQNWGSIYNLDTADSRRIFDSRLTYNKAASVIHMLRFVINDDQQFFEILQDYLQKYAFGNATTQEFKKIAEERTGLQLDTFFQQWIYGEGFPYLDVAWNQEKDSTFIRINQVASIPASIGLFQTPIEVKLYSGAGDTTIRLYTNLPSQTYSFPMYRVVDSIAIDPDRWLLYRQAQPPYRDANLNRQAANAVIYPNPANKTVYVAYKGLSDPAIQLFNAAGMKVTEHKMLWNSGIAEVDISLLPKGIYLYRISSDGEIIQTGKVMKL